MISVTDYHTEYEDYFKNCPKPARGANTINTLSEISSNYRENPKKYRDIILLSLSYTPSLSHINIW